MESRDLLIDHVHDTIGDQNVRDHNLGGVDENISALNCNGHITTTNGFQGCVAQQGTVTNRSLNNMILKNTGQLFSRQVRNEVSDGGESGICRCKDSDVLQTVDGGNEAGISQGSS